MQPNFISLDSKSNSAPEKYSKTLMNTFSIILAIAFMIIWFVAFFTKQYDSDAKYFYDFMGNFPTLYSDVIWGSYTVMYTPSFVFYYYPFYLMGQEGTFICVSIINLICMIAIIHLSYRIDLTFGLTASVILIISVYSLSIWGNPEMQVALANFFVYADIKKERKIKWWHPFVIAFFSFKFVSVVILLPILLKIDFRKWMKLVLYIGMYVVALNLWYILVNIDLITVEFFLELLSNKSTCIKPSLILFRISLSVPILYFILKIVTQLKEKYTNKPQKTEL